MENEALIILAQLFLPIDDSVFYFMDRWTYKLMKIFSNIRLRIKFNWASKFTYWSKKIYFLIFYMTQYSQSYN